MARDLFSFDLNCAGVGISPNGRSSVTVTLDDVEKSDVLDLFDVQEAIDHFGEKDILDQIGEDAVKKHFNLEE